MAWETASRSAESTCSTRSMPDALDGSRHGRNPKLLGGRTAFLDGGRTANVDQWARVPTFHHFNECGSSHPRVAVRGRSFQRDRSNGLEAGRLNRRAWKVYLAWKIPLGVDEGG